MEHGWLWPCSLARKRDINNSFFVQAKIKKTSSVLHALRAYVYFKHQVSMDNRMWRRILRVELVIPHVDRGVKREQNF